MAIDVGLVVLRSEPLAQPASSTVVFCSARRALAVQRGWGGMAYLAAVFIANVRSIVAKCAIWHMILEIAQTILAVFIGASAVEGLISVAGYCHIALLCWCAQCTRARLAVCVAANAFVRTANEGRMSPSRKHNRNTPPTPFPLRLCTADSMVAGTYLHSAPMLALRVQSVWQHLSLVLHRS